jgi:predicted dehydrogenase
MTILIEGLGAIANKHIHAIRQIEPQAKIYGLRSSENTNIIEGVINIYSYEELSEKLDFIIIANSTQYHRASIRKAIKIGVPLMIEKPVLHSIEPEDETLNNELLEKKIKTYVACNLRFHQVLLFLKRHLENNNRRINEVNVYCGSYFPEWRPNRDYKQVYSAKNKAGGGIHLELIHELDYTCWLLGLPKNTKKTLASKSSIEIEAPDYAHYLLEYESFFATITLNFYRKKIKRTIEILFDNDTWVIDIVNGHIMNDKNEVVFSTDFKILDTYEAQIKHIIAISRNEQKSLNTFQDSLEILRVCLTNG